MKTIKIFIDNLPFVWWTYELEKYVYLTIWPELKCPTFLDGCAVLWCSLYDAAAATAAMIIQRLGWLTRSTTAVKSCSSFSQ